MRIVLLISAIIMGLSPQAWGPYQYRQAIDDPLGQQKSQIYDVYGEYVVRGTKVHMASLRRMINTGVRRLSGVDDLADAWRSFIHDDDIVALKFTRVSGKYLGTNRAMAAALLQSLYSVGFKPKNFMLVGLDELPDEAAGTRPWRYGWRQEMVDFGSANDYLAQWLDEVTAIINIPSIMDDNIIGLRAAMANLTWEVLKSPARYYLNQGDPFIAEVYNLPEIRGKVRLHIINSLRILYHGGPEVKQSYVFERGKLIFSTDPVALDKMALELIRRERREKVLPKNAREIIDAPYLETAEAMGLGYNDLNFIEIKQIRHEKE